MAACALQADAQLFAGKRNKSKAAIHLEMTASFGLKSSPKREWYLVKIDILAAEQLRTALEGQIQHSGLRSVSRCPETPARPSQRDVSGQVHAPTTKFEHQWDAKHSESAWVAS